jgi:16S rRNA (guanine527-N7)-methyltransferase
MTDEINCGADESAVYLLEQALKEWGIVLTSEQRAQYDVFAKMLVEWNATRMNLTRLVTPRDIATSHFLDSIAATRLIDIPIGANVIDVGCGAGFPGLALKILRPDIKLTMLDSTAKKLSFCEAVAQENGIEDVNFVHDRAENIGKSKQFRGIFNIVTARAVASMEKLIPWTVDFLAPGGILAAWKGSSVHDEILAANECLKKYSLSWRIEEIDLPLSGDPVRTHRLVSCKKAQ